MTRKVLYVGLLVGMISSVSSGAFAAAAGDEGTVTASGVVMIKRQPELLRMMVDLSAQGKTPQEALANLKARRKASEAKLVDLGANKESFVQGEPHLPVVSDRQRQMEMMVRQRMRSSGKKPAKKAEDKTVSLTATLTAEFPLEAPSADDLLIAAQALTTKIRAADVAGAKQAAAASAEDQEASEEAAVMENEYGQVQQQPGEPRFVYVSKISAAEENKALAEAFEKAKARATQLSKAAGAELGAVRSLNGDQSANSSADEFLYAANAMYQESPYRYQMMQQRAMMMSGDGSREAVGPEPGPVTRAVGVMVTFGLK